MRVRVSLEEPSGADSGAGSASVTHARLEIVFAHEGA